jgi:hypothetical protein
MSWLQSAPTRVFWSMESISEKLWKDILKLNKIIRKYEIVGSEYNQLFIGFILDNSGPCFFQCKQWAIFGIRLVRCARSYLIK